MKLTIDCEKHGARVVALPKMDGLILLQRDKWPVDVTILPRVCVHCLAESMIPRGEINSYPTRRDQILETLKDLVGKFVFYDRKEDEDLPRGEIEAAVKSGEITVEEMEEAFGLALRNCFK